MGNQFYSKRIQLFNKSNKCTIIAKRKRRRHLKRGIKVNHTPLVKLSDSNFNVIPNIFSALVFLKANNNSDIKIWYLYIF